MNNPTMRVWGVKWTNELTGSKGRGEAQYTREEAERRCSEMARNDPDTLYEPYKAKSFKSSVEVPKW